MITTTLILSIYSEYFATEAQSHGGLWNWFNFIHVHYVNTDNKKIEL